MKKILIDTDVILDFFFDRKPFSNDSAILFSLCEREMLEGFVTPVIISNIYYILRRVANHDRVIEKIKKLLKILYVLPMDREVIEKALNSGFKDFEDALQNFSAINKGDIEVIVTRNIKDYKKSEIAVLTPDSFIKVVNSKII